MAGATDVLIRWRQGVWKPRYVLNIKRIAGLDEVSYSPDSGLSLGTLVTIRTLERHPLIQVHYPAWPRQRPPLLACKFAIWLPSGGMSAMPRQPAILCRHCLPMARSAASVVPRASVSCRWSNFAWALGIQRCTRRSC